MMQLFYQTPMRNLNCRKLFHIQYKSRLFDHRIPVLLHTKKSRTNLDAGSKKLCLIGIKLEPIRFDPGWHVSIHTSKLSL